MDSVQKTLTDSPVDFKTAVAYALSPDLRRLLILYILGGLLTPGGIAYFARNDIVDQFIGIVLLIIGLAFLFAGLVGLTFKVITDANRLANAETIDEADVTPAADETD